MRAVALALLLAGCTDDGSWSEVRLAQLEGSFGPIIDAPESAAIGEPLTVTVMTTGSGCIDVDHTDVEATEYGADIYPYNRIGHPGEGGKCPQILRPAPHVVTLTFETPGDKVIRTYGAGHAWDGEWVIELTAAIHVE